MIKKRVEDPVRIGPDSNFKINGNRTWILKSVPSKMKIIKTCWPYNSLHNFTVYTFSRSNEKLIIRLNFSHSDPSRGGSVLLPVMDCVGEEGGDEDVHAVLVEMVEEVRLLALVHAGCCPRERERERERGSRDRDYKQHLIFFCVCKRDQYCGSGSTETGYLISLDPDP